MLVSVLIQTSHNWLIGIQNFFSQYSDVLESDKKMVKSELLSLLVIVSDQTVVTVC